MLLGWTLWFQMFTPGPVSLSLPPAFESGSRTLSSFSDTLVCLRAAMLPTKMTMYSTLYKLVQLNIFFYKSCYGHGVSS